MNIIIYVHASHVEYILHYVHVTYYKIDYTHVSQIS